MSDCPRAEHAQKREEDGENEGAPRAARHRKWLLCGCAAHPAGSARIRSGPLEEVRSFVTLELEDVQRAPESEELQDSEKWQPHVDDDVQQGRVAVERIRKVHGTAHLIGHLQEVPDDGAEAIGFVEVGKVTGSLEGHEPG